MNCIPERHEGSLEGALPHTVNEMYMVLATSQHLWCLVRWGGNGKVEPPPRAPPPEGHGQMPRCMLFSTDDVKRSAPVSSGVVKGVKVYPHHRAPQRPRPESAPGG